MEKKISENFPRVNTKRYWPVNKVYKVGESDTDYVYIASSNYETNQSTMNILGDQVD